MSHSSEFRAGELVEVRSEGEILAMLNESGELEGMPFMPEMLEFCGKRFRVFKRAHKTCDPPNGFAGRGMRRAVHLEGARCTGMGHGGCQAKCLIFWKDAWLKRVDEDQPNGSALPAADAPAVGGARAICTRQDVEAAAFDPSQTKPDEPVYRCQSTVVPQFTHPLRWWDPRQYVEDYTSGNVSLLQMAAVFWFFAYSQLAAAGLGIGTAMRWAYDRVQAVRGRTSYPLRFGVIPRGARTPSARLDLHPNELVKVRPYEEIQQTLDEQGHNRGMAFDPEMTLYCDQEYRVLDRVTRIIDEKTGRMMQLKNACIVLDGVVCKACYAKYRRFCPRSIYPFWREIWLRRPDAASRPPEDNHSESSATAGRLT
jgi:hypothetical protein